MSDNLPSLHVNRIYSTVVFTFLSLIFFTGSAFVNSASDPSIGMEDRSMGELFQIRERITGYAQQFHGIHYKYAGRSPSTGFDCSGFTSFVLKEFDVSVSPSSAMQSTQGERIALNQVKAGDLVFFGRSGHIQHVAMVVKRTEEGIFCVHSTCSRGVIVENVSKSSYWKPRILFARDVVSSQTAPLDLP